MYVTVRRYKNAGALADAMESRSDEIESVIGGVQGFVSYHVTRDGDGMTSVTVCEDKAGCDESTRLAAEWVRENVSTPPGAPEISGGETFIDF